MDSFRMLKEAERQLSSKQNPHVVVRMICGTKIKGFLKKVDTHCVEIHRGLTPGAQIDLINPSAIGGISFMPASK